MKRKIEIGMTVRFMLQAGGYAIGKVVEVAAKNKHLFRIETATGEYWVMRAEIC